MFFVCNASCLALGWMVPQRLLQWASLVQNAWIYQDENSGTLVFSFTPSLQLQGNNAVFRL
jgi:hypothetical protein